MAAAAPCRLQAEANNLEIGQDTTQHISCHTGHDSSHQQVLQFTQAYTVFDTPGCKAPPLDQGGLENMVCP